MSIVVFHPIKLYDKKKWNFVHLLLKIDLKIWVYSINNPCKKSSLADFDPCWRDTEAAEASDSPHNGT